MNTCLSSISHPVIAPADLHTAVVQLHGNGKQKKKTLAGTLKLKVCYRVNNIPRAHIFILTSWCPVCSDIHCWEHFNRRTRTCKSGFAAAERKQKFKLWTALEWFNVILKERARIWTKYNHQRGLQCYGIIVARSSSYDAKIYRLAPTRKQSSMCASVSPGKKWLHACKLFWGGSVYPSTWMEGFFCTQTHNLNESGAEQEPHRPVGPTGPRMCTQAKGRVGHPPTLRQTATFFCLFLALQ